MRVVFEGFLVLVVLRVGRIDFLFERSARVFQRGEIVTGGANTFVQGIHLAIRITKYGLIHLGDNIGKAGLRLFEHLVLFDGLVLNLSFEGFNFHFKTCWLF